MLSQGIRSRVVLWAVSLVPAHSATSGAFFDAKTSFSWLLDAVDRFPVENCNGYSGIYVSWSPNTTKPAIILPSPYHFMQVGKMCTGIPTSWIPVSYAMSWSLDACAMKKIWNIKTNNYRWDRITHNCKLTWKIPSRCTTSVVQWRWKS